jgi:uncharacterized protein (DUF2384 family)
LAVLEDVERAALKSVDDSLRQIQTSLEEAARRGALDKDTLDRLGATAKRAAQRVNESLPPQLDERATSEIRARLIAILTLDINETSSLDVADRFLMEMEAVRHIVRDVLDEQPPVELRDVPNVVALLESWLPGVTVGQLAEILGLSTRGLQRRRRGEGGEATHRIGLVARLVAILRHSWTSQGVAAWFHRPQSALGGRKPIELLDDPASECQWPPSSPQVRPSVLPTGGHVFSPLVATKFPTARTGGSRFRRSGGRRP